ncbi:MAG: GHKL domain-containing protein [Gammaproteobacteria bacterium]|nr:GHKL domain-containing protein [Gammaproteobacteria bacterium]
MSLFYRNLIANSFILILFLSASGVFIHHIYQKDTEDFLSKQLKDNLYALLASAKENEQGNIKMPRQLPNPELNRPGSQILASVIMKKAKEQSPYRWFSLSYKNQSSLINKQKQNLFYDDKNTAGDYIFNNHPENFKQLSLNISWENYQQIEQQYTFRILISRNDIDNKLDNFEQKLKFWLGTTGVILYVIQLLLLYWGLYPLKQASLEIEKIQTGEITELDTNYPKEISLLTININKLINYSNGQLKRYRNSLGDLSHSLKTPLAVIQGYLDNNNSTHSSNEQREIQEQINNINNKIQYHLQRASIASDKPLLVKTNIFPLIQKTLNALNKVYFDKDIQVKYEQTQKNVYCHLDEADALELIGNLLDNAFKYALSSVQISIQAESDNSTHLIINLCNDTDTVKEIPVKQILERGKRLDEHTEGQGIGLYLVADIVRSYQGELDISNEDKQVCIKVKLPGNIYL